MLYQEPRDLPTWQQLVSRCGGSWTAEQDAQLRRFVLLVSRWNDAINLTASKSTPSMLEILCADAIHLAALLHTEMRSITDTTRETAAPAQARTEARTETRGSARPLRAIDVGSGSGAPALPLVVLHPTLHCTLVEPLQKRVAFLNTARAELGLLTRTHVRHGKIGKMTTDEYMGQDAFDLAMSRATFDPSDWLAIGTTLAPWTVVFGTDPHALPKHPEARLRETRSYHLPFSQSNRVLALYERTP
jgi:16S rRNA G527 N7-methylase RsmG